jgi:ferredoxin
MRFEVDLTACENHGQCVYVAPDLFKLDEDGELSYRRETETQYVSAELAPDAEQPAGLAAELCPMQAIRIIK